MTSVTRMTQASAIGQSSPRKAVGTARETVTRRRHDVPATLMPCLRQEIIGSLRAGRSVEQTRKEYNCTAAVALELWLRDMERRLAVFARPAAATACLVMGLTLIDGWEAVHGDGTAIERSFRKAGRARKRGLEDGLSLIDLKAATPAAA